MTPDERAQLIEDIQRSATRRGRIDEAQEHYQKALAIDSSYLPARVALADSFLKKGRLADSREEIRKAIHPGGVLGIGNGAGRHRSGRR